MKKLLSVRYTAAAFNVAMLILRAGMGILSAHHGYDKLVHFDEYNKKFINFLGMGTSVSLGLVVFSEFFCALFVIFGLLTRLAVIPLIISMSVALFVAHGGQVFGDGEHASLFILGFVAILLVGPGRISVDRLLRL